LRAAYQHLYDMILVPGTEKIRDFSSENARFPSAWWVRATGKEA
jgi:hypothetical protein